MFARVINGKFPIPKPSIIGYNLTRHIYVLQAKKPIAYSRIRSVVKKNEKELANCIICGTSVDPNISFVFNFNEDLCYFCNSHSEPFKMGISIGQLEINSKFLAFISNLPDPVSKQDLRRSLMQLVPMTKVQTSTLEKKNMREEIITNIFTPQELYDELCKTVIGQELAKKSVSVAVINHLQFIEDDDDEVEITHSDKHHVLLLGQSGSGKTLITNSIAKFFNLPFTTGDATNYSPTGFQGADADSAVYDLLLSTDMNFELAERGIVFIDEIDKICASNKKSDKHESFIGSTQSTLLKLVEGKTVKVPGQVYGGEPGSSANLDTSRMLFFFGGAFDGLAEIVAKKMGLKDKVVGFRQKDEEKNKELDEAMKSYEIFAQASREVMAESLIEFGMLSELVGRIPTFVPLKPLGKEELKKILLESSVSPTLKQKTFFAKSGYDIEFTEECIDEIVKLSHKSTTGARALDSYVKQCVSAASFDCLNLHRNPVKNGKVIISTDCILDPTKYQKIVIPKFTSFSTSATM